MEYFQLQYFQAVAEAGNLTRAAEALHVTPPAVSKGIRKMEKELGLQLFIRTGRIIYLSPDGHTLFPLIQSALASYDRIYVDAQKLRQNIHHNYVLAAQNGDVFFPSIKEYMLKFPQNSISQISFRPKVYLASPKLYKADMIITTMQLPTHPSWDKIHIYSQKKYLVVSHDHPLAKKDAFYLKEASNYTFLSTYSTDPDAEQIFATNVQEFIKECNFQPKSTTYCTNELASSLCSQAYGFMITGHLGSRIYTEPTYKLISLLDKCNRPEQGYLYYRKSTADSTTLQDYITILKQSLSDIQDT